MALSLEKEDRIISYFLKSLGPWSAQVAIGGGFALFVYALYFPNQAQTPPIGTKDLDSLLPRKILKISGKDIAQHLSEAGFTQFYRDYANPATESYTMELENIEIEIEFLTDDKTRGDKNKNVSVAGIIAQPLSYLSLSLNSTIPFKTYSGEQGYVVSPEAWIFHKGLTFPKRTNILKACKDLYGIWYVTTQLTSFSDQAVEKIRLFVNQHPKWFKDFQRNLRTWIEEAAPSEWLKLEAQDPFGKLTKSNFERIITRITT